ncbi:MAG: VCBS repeat-containing protein, partial [Bacteroidota bacterium]
MRTRKHLVSDIIPKLIPLCFLTIILIGSNCSDPPEPPRIDPCVENPSCRIDCPGNCTQAGGFTFLVRDTIAHGAGINPWSASKIESHSGDFNGDGIPDILFNQRHQDKNHVSIMYGDGEGHFSNETKVRDYGFQYDNGQTNWWDFSAHVGDFNGDG